VKSTPGGKTEIDGKRKREKERVRKQENYMNVWKNKREKYTEKAEIFILESCRIFNPS